VMMAFTCAAAAAVLAVTTAMILVTMSLSHG
jgi:hypothetical protein